MNGIDVSGWQPENITALVDYDFVIIKATEGTSFVSPKCDKQYQYARQRGKCVGVYHFLSGLDPVAEANFFVDNIKGYLGEALVVLDWEAHAINMGREWLRSVIRQVKARTTAGIAIYGSRSPIQSHGIDTLAKEEGVILWVAAYPNSNTSGYRDEQQQLGSKIRQYTSKGRLSGYNGDLDLNRSIMTPEEWKAYAKGDIEAPTAKPIGRKSNDEIANEVISGLWGNGEDRKNRLTVSGYIPTDIQSIVNVRLGGVQTKKSLAELTSEVIGGLWGNGEDRKTRLQNAGYNFDDVQKAVNQRLQIVHPETSKAEYYTVPSGAAGYNGNTAKKFGITVDQLVAFNKSKYPNMTANYVQAGWVLRVK